MFELNEDTRAAIVEIIKTRLDVKHTDEEINEVINEVVDTVKSQFGF
jgi:hypothetical protein